MKVEVVVAELPAKIIVDAVGVLYIPNNVVLHDSVLTVGEGEGQFCRDFFFQIFEVFVVVFRHAGRDYADSKVLYRLLPALAALVAVLGARLDLVGGLGDD